MDDNYPKNYQGIQDDRDQDSSLFDYREEAKALLASSAIAGGILLPAEMAEEVYGPSEVYNDSADFAHDLYLEGSSWIHEGLDVSFDVINSIL